MNLKDIPNIDINPKDWAILKGILDTYVPEYEVWAFGSRAKWSAKEYSDLDLAIITNKTLDISRNADLTNAFQDSPLPWKVDIVDWSAADESFRKRIIKDRIIIKQTQTQKSDDWATVSLGDCVILKSGGTPSKSNEEFWNGAIPWISAKDMKNYFIEDSEDHLTEAGLAEAKHLLAQGTTLLLVRGMTLHNDIPICRIIQPSTINQDVKAVLCRENMDSAFLPCLLRANKERLLSIVDSAGHGTGRLNTEELLSLPIQLPPLSLQRTIASIIGNLDDKIELNRKTCKTLEEMARVLFKSWFVDFDPVRAKAAGEKPASICKRLGLTREMLNLFPSKLVDSELGEIPEGWGVESLGELCKRISMGPFGSDIKASNFVPTGVPIIRGGNLTNGFIDNDFVFLTEEKADELHNANAFSGDIVITHRGTLGQIGLIPKDSSYARYVVSQSQMVVGVNKTRITSRYLYEYLRTPTGQQSLLANTSQVGVPAIARPTTSLRSIQLIHPDLHLVQEYDSLWSNHFNRIEALKKEMKTLALMRDSLLPKLISGEIEVPAGAKT
jgi:type I restriction enzyme, S subunit